MSRPVAAADSGMAGRSLLTLANMITVAAPLPADWNDSHIFNERWPAHARFHGVTALAMATSLSAAKHLVDLVWRRGPGQGSVFRGGGSGGVLGAVLCRPTGSGHRGR